MASDLVAYSRSEHPAPRRERVGLPAVLYGLFAAPIVWSGQLMATYGLASHACYPGRMPLPRPDAGFGWVGWGMLAIDIVALCLIASGGLVAWRSWRLTDPPAGHAHHLVDVGEGRLHFVGVCGAAFAAVFLLLGVTQTVALALVPLCGH